jgi:uncharacterized membrane protein
VTSASGSLAPPPAVDRPVAGAPRIVAVDVARGLAVLGMFAAHMWPRAELDERVFDGRSAILFATLAGISLGLSSGGSRPVARGRRAPVVGSVLIRAAVLVLLGLVLQAWNEYVLVILPYYGVMFALLAVVLFAPRPVLLGLAAVVTAIAPWLADQVPVTNLGSPVADGFPGLAADALLAGSYPALVWLPFLLVGLVAARSDLRRPRTAVVMLVGGLVAAIVGYGSRWLPGASSVPALDPTAHEGAPAEIVGSGGTAVAVVGLLLLAMSAARPAGRAIATALSPLAAVGSQPLTIYSAHLVLTAPLFTLYRLDGGRYGLPLGWLVAAIVLTIAWAVLWRRFLGRGPLERLVARVSRPWRSAGGPVPDSRS